MIFVDFGSKGDGIALQVRTNTIYHSANAG